jgi:hypothetical protein
MKLWLIPLILQIAAPLISGEAAELTAVDDHLGWGWKAQVLRNDLVTVAVVPAIGGRMMQYDLSDHPFLWVNPAEIGRTYEPEPDAGWANFGGYKSWVAPQGSWVKGGGVWPPAPTLDRGEYASTREDGEGGAITLVSTGPVETLDRWQAKGLSLTRRFTLRPRSTQVRVEQRILNQGMHPQVVSNWDVTQVPGVHAEANDPDNFWVYFPVNPRSMFGQRGYFAFPSDGRSGSDSQWKNWIADGIAGVQYLRRNGKIGADVIGGWVAYTDERDGYTFVKRFDISAVPSPASWPDGGSTVQVYTNGREPYIEVEVLGPLVDLQPQQQTIFTVDWYATRLDGPILKATEAGACKQRLSVSRSGPRARVNGLFGVFHLGTIELQGLPATEGKTPAKPVALGSYYVSPLEPLTLDVEVTLPPTVGILALVLRDADGKSLGEIDRVAVPQAEPPAK